MKVSVIGGGYAGLYTAYSLGDQCSVEVFEEHGRVGYPKHCTGLVSEQTVRMIGEPAIKCIDAAYEQIVMIGSKKDYKVAIRKRGLIYHLNRPCLEEKLLEKTAERSRIKLKCKALIGREKPLLLETCKGTVKADFVIIAEGNQRLNTRKYYSIDTRTITGLNAIVELESTVKPRTVTVGFDHNIAKGFFYWIVPQSNKKAIIGLGTTAPKRAGEAISMILRKHGLVARRIVEYYGGGVNTGPPAVPLGRKPWNILAVGDASGMTKPLTGGGLYPLAKVFSLTGGRDCEDKLKNLVKAVEKVNSELWRQWRIARLAHEPSYQKLIDKILKNIGEIYSPKELGDLVDYDEHIETLKRMVLKRPISSIKLLFYVMRETGPLIVKELFRTLF